MSTKMQADRIADATGTDEGAVASGKSIKATYVYEAPVRLWHWVNALAIVVLAVTGFFIGSPPATRPGEASANFLMGYIRFAHFVAAYIFAIGMLGRIYWATAGNHHSRELFSVPVFTRAYWQEVISMLRWYAFLSARPSRYVGHNPLARFAMFFIFFLSSVFMILTGFAMYGEGAQMGSWQERMFGWVIFARSISGCAYLASFGYVVHCGVCDRPCLCSDSRGHHGPPERSEHDGLGLSDL